MKEALESVAFPEFRVGQAPGHGHSVWVVIRYGFKPQYQRECAAQYP